jgi:hypothetical protein
MSSYQLAMIQDDLLSVTSMSDISFVSSNCSNTSTHPTTATFRSLGQVSPDPTQSFAMMTSASPKQSRFVSVESMLHVSTRQSPSINMKNHTAPRTQISVSTLVELINKKKQQSNSSKRSLLVSSSVFSKPSQVLSQVTQKSFVSCSTADASYGPPATKKRKTLHEVCCRSGSDLTLTELEAVLDQDPRAASRPVLTKKVKKVYNIASGKVESKVVPEIYQYPLNLAISYKASPDVLQRLLEVAPQVLSLPDNKSCSLHILLRHKPTDAVSAKMMMLKNPEMVSWTDAKKNSALHVAVSSGASVQTVRHVTALYPKALLEPNFHGQIPLELAQRSSSSICSEEVCDYLWDEVQKEF